MAISDPIMTMSVKQLIEVNRIHNCVIQFLDFMANKRFQLTAGKVADRLFMLASSDDRFKIANY